MRILKLTAALEKKLIDARERRDVQAETVASRIIGDVRRRGDAALLFWTRKLDGINLARQGIWVSQREIGEAQKSVSADLLRAIKHAIRNVRKVAEKQLPPDWSMEVEPGVSIGQMVRPIETIGCYIPGGKATLLSTLVMTAVPAQVAGAKRIVAVCSRPNNELLAAAGLLGLREVARIGGAQAIAALAYGTKTIPRVDKIFGPGNRFVTAAKQLVSRDCAIDLPAGPTEAAVIASQGNASWIAADLLAQAEHAPDAGSILVTTSARLARDVRREIAEQLRNLPKTNAANISLRTRGLILLVPSEDAAITFVNRFAPEHLSFPQSGAATLRKITAAGTVFVGPRAAQPLGDYASGSNHVLPTGGWARSRGGLSASDFVKCISLQTINREGFGRLANDVQTLARAENLLAHENAVAVRQ
ncbi:MAG: Histidinol dehydrogenase [Candidatus Acidoferrum typicum]|nr:Histidinol dehydrogenase [Candidatus Acidoferrum typicum]